VSSSSVSDSPHNLESLDTTTDYDSNRSIDRRYHPPWMPLQTTPADPDEFSTDLREFGNDLVAEAADEADGVGDVWQGYHVDEIEPECGVLGRR
jgi:hypothetical protein